MMSRDQATGVADEPASSFGLTRSSILLLRLLTYLSLSVSAPCHPRLQTITATETLGEPVAPNTNICR